MAPTVIDANTDTIPPHLRAMWQANNTAPLWESPSGKSHGNRGPEAPHIWRWEACREMVDETAKNSSPKLVERRVLVMVNPESAANGNDATVGQISGNFQTLLPGERARPHRHSMDALRFPIIGSGAVTFVDGKACPMEVGDLILTPGWTWHEHVHNGTEPVVWVDILNVILHRSIGTEAFEPGPVHNPPKTFPDALFAVPNLLPVLENSPNYSPMFRYRYADAAKAVASAPVSADGSQRVRYANPLTGGSCMALLDCYLIRLAAGQETTRTRSTASSLCVVVEGEGVSNYEDGASLSWKAKDTFTIPQRNSVSHRAGPEGATIFQVTDREVYSRLGLLKEELIT